MRAVLAGVVFARVVFAGVAFAGVVFAGIFRGADFLVAVVFVGVLVVDFGSGDGDVFFVSTFDLEDSRVEDTLVVVVVVVVFFARVLDLVGDFFAYKIF